MELELRFLKMVDFMAFAGVHVVRFNAEAPGLHFVRGQNVAEPSLGSNGAAKSTVWSALTWCLFGRTVEGLRNPDVRSWYGGKVTRVTVRISVGGKLKRITRSTHPNRLRINGRDAGQEQVEKLVGLSYDLFVHTLLLGQEQPLFMDRAPGVMLQIFSDVLGLSAWEERSARAADVARGFVEKAQKYESKLAAAGARVDMLTQQLKDARGQKARFQDDIDEECREIEAEWKGVKEKIESLSVKIRDSSLKEDWQGAEYKLQKTDFENLYDELFVLRDKLSSADERRRSLRKELSRLKVDLEEAGGNHCPTCGQPLSGTDMGRELKAHRKKIRTRIAEVTEKLGTLRAGKIRRDYKKKEDQIEAARARLNALEAEVKALNSDLNIWKSGLSEAQARDSVLKERVSYLQKQTNPHAKRVRQLQRDLDAAFVDVDSYTWRRDRLLRRAGCAEFWVKGFKDVRLHILTEVLEELQFAANSMLESMGLVGWDMQFSIERETKAGGTRRGINVTVSAPGSLRAVKWRAWSGGERQRLRLAGSLALSEVLLAHAGVTPDFEILDEPTRSLSEEGVEDLCDFLAERGRMLKRKIWYTDHHVMEGQVFNSTLLVEKTESGARFVEG